MKNYSFKNFLLNSEASYSITRPHEAKQITNFIKRCTSVFKKPEEITITDATACVGGDTINFALNFKNVISVEMNKETFDLLCLNTKIFNCNNVTLINEDYTKCWDSFLQDIIYIDAPWNGSSYKTKKEIELELSGVPLHELIKKIIKKNRENKFYTNIFVKVPLNIDSSMNSLVKDRTIILNRSGKASFIIFYICDQ